MARSYLDVIPTWLEASFYGPGTPWPASVRRIHRGQLVPHCDCVWANEEFFNYKDAGYDSTTYFPMVPTKATNGSCTHCGHAAFMTEQQEQYRAPSKSRRKQGPDKRSKNRGHLQPYRLTHTKTGEVIEFPSVKAATEAGFLRVSDYVTTNRLLKGYRVERIKRA